MKLFRFGSKLAVVIAMVLLVCFVGETHTVQAFPRNAPLNENISTLPDLVIDAVTTDPAYPRPGEAFTVNVTVSNIGGGTPTVSYYVDMYVDRPVSGYGDYWASGPLLAPGSSQVVVISVPAGLTEGIHEIIFWLDIFDVVVEEENANNGYVYWMNVGSPLFEDDFEGGNLSKWSSVNTGGGFLTACPEAAINGGWGACVARGTTNNRKQLIDQTPADEIKFLVRFNFDVNSLSMGLGEPVRIMQIKMGSERPAFLVLQRFSDGYRIQLNVKEDDLSKVKTPWIPLSNAPHTIRVTWIAATGPGANNGYASLIIDDSIFSESLTGLDTDSFTITSFRMGFTSSLAGKNILGIFYIDDVATSNGVPLGLP